MKGDHRQNNTYNDRTGHAMYSSEMPAMIDLRVAVASFILRGRPRSAACAIQTRRDGRAVEGARLESVYT